ncbi:MAG: 3-hydroxyacyl-CoA dehydrogenase [Pirellulaceae bacterium]|nr:MAG: 3-hydroxyacyl-CoA dehydrogenase [Pirellulaceae bacterium]
MDLEHRTILVTGAASGLGAAAARRLAAAGANVVGLDRQAPLQAEPAVAYFQGDVTSEPDVERLIEICREKGGLYGVVHCAGVLHGRRVVGKQGPHPLDEFVSVIQVNLVGSFNVARLAAAAMQKNEPAASGERGVIVLTSSIAAFEGQIGQAAYSASKGGVASMTLPMARELGQWAIRVVSIAPGVFETPMMAAASDAVREPLLQATVFPRRFGQPDEFASLVLHVFQNPMLNGTVLRLDGALRMPPR